MHGAGCIFNTPLLSAPVRTLVYYHELYAVDLAAFVTHERCSNRGVPLVARNT